MDDAAHDDSLVKRWTGRRAALALAAGAVAVVESGFTIFDEQHNGGAGLCIVLAMVQLGAVLIGRAAAPVITLLLAAVIAGRVGVRFALGASFDGLGLAVALLVAIAGIALLRRPRRA